MFNTLPAFSVDSDPFDSVLANMVQISPHIRRAAFARFIGASAVLWLLCLIFGPSAGAAPSHLWLPKDHFGPKDLALIVNEGDPLSVRIGRYYQKRRSIPPANVIHVDFKADRDVMPLAEFNRIYERVVRLTPARVQAYALTWRRPYRVACMSITSAFAMGFDKRDCASGCKPTRASPYFDSDSVAPFDAFGIRPTMTIAAGDFADAKALIDRGVASDDTWPTGTGYLVETNDKRRNVRAAHYGAIVSAMRGDVDLRYIHAGYIENRRDVLFYFIGATRVPHLDSNRFLPGAIADHLTSTGGELMGSGQMNSLRWLQAGATGSYGAVVEPCNFPGKFPNPWVVIKDYTQGETLLEAYWKSVRMPGQGIFIGEPLARPFGGYRVSVAAGTYLVRTRSLRPGTYALLAADQDVGPYALVQRGIRIGMGVQTLALPKGGWRVYALIDKTAVTPGGLALGTVRVALAPSGQAARHHLDESAGNR